MEQTLTNQEKKHRVFLGLTRMQDLQSRFQDVKEWCFSFALAAKLIADCEKTVHLNLTASANEWAYGQTFALVATLPAISEVTNQ